MNRQSIKIDWISFILYLIFILAGWLNIYSSSSGSGNPEIFDLTRNFGKQFLFIVVTLLLGLAILYLDPRFIEFVTYGIYGLSVSMLILVLLFGSTINGSLSWIKIGGFQIQPSEFSKIAVCLSLAKVMSKPNFSLDKIFDRAKVALVVLIPITLILLQKDTGTAMVFLALGLMFIREGLSLFYLVLAIIFITVSLLSLIYGPTIAVASVWALMLLSFYFIFRKQAFALHFVMALGFSFYAFFVDYVVFSYLKPHQQARVMAFLDPEIDPKGIGWNITQSKIAIGSGSFWGKGYLKGTQTKYDFVPEQDTDFIFCTVGEELGWVGSSLLLLAFLAFLYRLIFMAENSKTKFARIYGYSAASIFFFHIMVNVGMTIGLMPVIGIPLPFFSYGGSSLLSFSTLYFLLLNFYSNRMNVFATED